MIRSILSRSVLTLIAVTVVAAPGRGSEFLTPHSAEYKVKVSVLGGKLNTRVTETGDGYKAVSTLRASGIAGVFVRGNVEESSWFSTSDEGVRPEKYKSVDMVSKEDKYMDFAYDWDTLEVSGTINEEKYSFELDDNVHDRVSLQYELMHDLQNGERRDKYLLMDGDEMKELSVSYIGDKEIKVPYGKFLATGIQHKEQNKDRVTTLWCVEELGYLPAMIEQHRDGKLRVRASLAKYESAAETPAAANPF